MINYRDLMAQHDMYYILEQVCGLAPKTRGTASRAYFCPFHEDKHKPSLIASAKRVKCACGCQISYTSTPAADGVDMVRRVFNLSFKEALELINGGPSLSPSHAVKPAPARVVVPLQIQAVQRTMTDFNYTLPFLQSRGIDVNYARSIRLGVWKNYVSKQHSYTFQYGRWAGKTLTGSLPIPRYSIPMFRTKPDPRVYAIRWRLDECEAMKRLPSLNRDLKLAIADEYKGEARDESVEKFAIRMLYSDKYLTWGDGHAIFQSWQICKWENGFTFPKIPFAFVMESQYDAINLYQETSIPCVAVGGTRYLASLLRNVEHVFFVRDNDATSIDKITGEVFVKGHRIAERWMKDSGKSAENTTNLDPFEGCKDVGEMVKAGVLTQWVNQQSIKGVKQWTV